MSTTKINYLAVLFLILTVNVWAQNTPPKQRTIVLSNAGKPYQLDIKLYQGKIKVTGYEGKNIIMESEGKVSVHADETDNKVTVSTGFMNDEITVKLKVPRNNGALKLGILNKGSVEVTDFTGEIETSNVNGGIILTGISGSAMATTVTGDIIIKFSKVVSDKPMAFSNLSGKIDITYPANTNASLRLKSDNGKIISDFKISAPSGVGESQYIKINGGGSETLIKNMFGDIFVRKAQ